MKRIGIDDVLPPTVATSVNVLRANPTLRALSVCLDQIANRADVEAKQHGQPFPADTYEHAADLAHAATLVQQLEDAAVVGRKLVEAIRDQFPAPAPKGGKRG